MRNFFAILLVVLLVALFWYFGLGGTENKSQQNGGNVVVDTYVIAESPVYDRVEALGTTYANESIDITANTTETIKNIYFEDGQEVAQGDVIAVLEQDEEQAQLKASQVQLAEHERELERLAGLLANKVISKREYDERKTLLDINKQRIEEIKARIGERTLRAPFDGVLGLRRLSVGALVRPGDIITTLDDIRQIKLDFNVPDIYLNKIHKAMPIQAHSVSLRDRLFEGVISTIDSRVNPITRSVLVRAVIDNEDKIIRPGLLMQVLLLKDQRKAIVAPEEAVFQKKNKHYVMLLEEGSSTVRQQEVHIGIRRPGIVEITQGLEIEDRVVIRGIHKVRDGQAVEVRNTLHAVDILGSDSAEGAK